MAPRPQTPKEWSELPPASSPDYYGIVPCELGSQVEAIYRCYINSPGNASDLVYQSMLATTNPAGQGSGALVMAGTLVPIFPDRDELRWEVERLLSWFSKNRPDLVAAWEWAEWVHRVIYGEDELENALAEVARGVEPSKIPDMRVTTAAEAAQVASWYALRALRGEISYEEAMNRAILCHGLPMELGFLTGACMGLSLMLDDEPIPASGTEPLPTFMEPLKGEYNPYLDTGLLLRLIPKAMIAREYMRQASPGQLFTNL